MTSGRFGGGGGGGGGGAGWACAPFAHPWIRAWISIFRVTCGSESPRTIGFYTVFYVICRFESYSFQTLQKQILSDI